MRASGMEGVSAKESLWTRDFVLSLAAKLFSSLAFATLSATLASYALVERGFSSFQAGFLVGVFVLASVASRIVAGRYADLVGCRRVTLWSTGLFFAVMPLYFALTSFAGLVGLRVVHGLLFGVLNNTITMMTTRCIPSSRFGEGMAYFSLSVTLSTAVGPGAGVLLAGLGYFDAIFAACTAYVAVTFAAACLGLGYGTAHSTCQTVCVQAVPPQRVGVATSTFYLFADVGLALGPTVMGCLNPSMGYAGVYVLTALVVLGGLAFYRFTYGKNARSLPS